MIQYVIITSGPKAKTLQINGSILAVCEDIQRGIHPQQNYPRLEYDQENDQTLMVCHPAALKRVMINLQEGDNRIQYGNIPLNVKGTKCLFIPLADFCNYIAK